MAAMASSWHRCVWLIVGLRSIERQRPWSIRLGPKDFLDTPYRFWWQVVFPKGLVFFSPLRSYPCDQYKYIYIYIYTPVIILLPHVNMSFQLSFCDTYTLNDINSNGALYPHKTHIIFHVTRPLREAVFRWFFTSKLGNPTTVHELSETKVLGDQKTGATNADHCRYENLLWSQKRRSLEILIMIRYLFLHLASWNIDNDLLWLNQIFLGWLNRSHFFFQIKTPKGLPYFHQSCGRVETTIFTGIFNRYGVGVFVHQVNIWSNITFV